MCKKEKKRRRNEFILYPELDCDMVKEGGSNAALNDKLQLESASKGLFINPDYIQQIIK